jgi:hypothetical protein
VIRNMVA